jgi:hypothetical protein
MNLLEPFWFLQYKCQPGISLLKSLRLATIVSFQ